MINTPKRPRDANQLAKSIVDITTGEADDELVKTAEEIAIEEGKDPAAVALGRKGGLKGGKARAAKMTPKERSDASRKAAKARWAKTTEQPEDDVADRSSTLPRGVIQSPEG